MVSQIFDVNYAESCNDVRRMLRIGGRKLSYAAREEAIAQS